MENDVRLNISEYDTSEEYGVVVVCVDGMEVRVCGDEWTSKETKVICRQLGFPPGLHVHLHACRQACMYVCEPLSRAAESQNSSVADLLSDQEVHTIMCSGEESHLMNCIPSMDSMCHSHAKVTCGKTNIYSKISI